MTDEPEPAAPVPPAKDPAPRRKPMGWLLRLLVAGGSLGTVMGVGLALIFAPYKLPSGSMWPSMKMGDRFLVNKLAKEPFRGALMVFRYPEHPESLFTKRIVGLSGDVVSVAGGELSINGWKVPRCSVGHATYREEGDGAGEIRHEGTLFVEYLGLATYLVFDEKTAFEPLGEGPGWTVAPGEYFVLGDNRRSSHDSRQWFGGKGGGVPLANTRGRVVGREAVELPRGAEDLGPALAACLAKRPSQTDPPPAK